MKITTVIAAYNEAECIGLLTSRLAATLDAMDGVRWELIYVIEGTDGTREIVQSLAASRPEIRIVYNPEPSGLGSAFRRGFGLIADDTDLVVTMDADLNHQPEEIPALVQALRERKADIVVGSRKVRGSLTDGAPLWKATLSDFVNRLMRRALGTPVADQTSGFRVYRYSSFRAISFENTGFAFLPEILIRAHALGFSIVEEPIHFIFREAGVSKMNLMATAWSYIFLFRAASKNSGGRPEWDRRSWDRHWANYLSSRPARTLRALHRWTFHSSVRRMAEKHFPSAGTFLEAGCGPRPSATITRLSRCFLGLDFSPVALRAAAASGFFDARVCGDILQLPVRSGTMEGIWNFGVMEHFRPGARNQALSEFRRVLKPGGVVILFWPAEWSPSRWILGPVERLWSLVTRRRFQFFPDEVGRLKSKMDAKESLETAGFRVLEIEFSLRTAFLHMIVVGEAPPK